MTTQRYHLYGAVVAQARQSAFYTDFAVPDTLDGRFDMIVLHSFMVLRRLEENGQEGHDLAQRTFDVMFKDMDQSLREMGVGDLSVPKKIKAMAEVFYGQVDAYTKALVQDEDGVLEQVLARNIFVGCQSGEDQSGRLANYIRTSVNLLAEQSMEEIKAAKLSFANIAAPNLVPSNSEIGDKAQ